MHACLANNKLHVASLSLCAFIVTHIFYEFLFQLLVTARIILEDHTETICQYHLATWIIYNQ